MDKPMKQITSLKSSQQLRQYLQSHRNLNLSLMKDQNSATLLHYACFKNDLIKLKIYFQHYKAYCQMTHGKKMYETGFEQKVKAWINQANMQGLTALHFASLHGNIEIIKILQQLGGNMQFKTKQQENLLFMAVQNNHLKTLIYLIEQSQNKIDINQQNHIGDTILHKAARNIGSSIISYLLTTKINVNLQNNQGWTALMEAVNANNKEIVKTMLLKGVDRHIINNDARKAIEMAKEDNKNDLVMILNDQFTFMEKVKIACNVKLVYQVEKSSYTYSILFFLLYNLVFLPTCILTQFRNVQTDMVYLPIIFQGVYYSITIILFILLILKPFKRPPKKCLTQLQTAFCSQCRNKKKNQYHCFICQTCIYRYDHHCPWINNCVGGRNIGKFYSFLWFIFIGTVFVVICHLCMLGIGHEIIKYRSFAQFDQGLQKLVSICCIIIAGFFGVSIFLLIIRQTKNLMTNTTQYERSKMSKLSKSKSLLNKPSSTILTEQEQHNNNKTSFISLSDMNDQDDDKGYLKNCVNMLCSKVD